ncbi:MAG TPA: SDR family oxidoreductase [Ktedonobacteraceae bacterium]|jgi:NADP-dependent 3-hydroxy acid dehydrogenase YdfG
MPGLENKVAVVTGASSGVGSAIAQALARERCHVFLTGRDGKRLQDVASSIKQQGGSATFAAFDLKDSTRLRAFITDAAHTQGRLDILVNAAGVDYPGTVADSNEADWRDMFDINVLAVLAGSQAAIAAMRETKSAGHIVTISSYAGRGEGFRVYGATKAAVNSICRSLTMELEDDHIRSVNIMPGAVATNFGRTHPPEFVNQLLGAFGIPAHVESGGILPPEALDALSQSPYFASADDIARAVVYAVSQPQDVSVSEIVVGPRKSFPHVG